METQCIFNYVYQADHYEYVRWTNKTFNYKRKSKVKVKQFLYTPWRRLGGEEV